MTFQYHPEIAKLGAAHLVTPDLDKSLWFFHEIIGLEITARTENKVYLRAAMEHEHHSLMLEAGDRAEARPRLLARAAARGSRGLPHDPH